MSFINRFRRFMLVSSNVKRYGLYAIGELLLVVLGILIAIQINDWRNEREDRLLETYYFNRMMSDMDESTEDLEEAMKSATMRVKLGRKILLLCGESSFDIQDVGMDSLDYGPFNRLFPEELSEISKDLSLLKYIQVFDARKAGFTEVISTGNLSVIQDKEIRAEIVSFYNQLEDWQELNSSFRSAGQRYLTQLENAGIGQIDLDPQEVILEKVKSSPGLIAVIKSNMALSKEQTMFYGVMTQFIQEFKDKLGQNRP